ncbi:MAG: D-cysteine desulfhydrase family protein, partial [Candidatus Bathyarchaeota archaeon]
MQIATLPRARLAHLPTPLQKLSTLTKQLNGPAIYIKRDDLTGLAFGGNKLRKLEFLMGDAQRAGADIIVAGIQGFQSNHLVQTAAAARHLGLDVVLVKTGPVKGYDPLEYDGNHLLQYLLGADIRVFPPDQTPKLEDIALKLREQGRTPYIISQAGSTPVGTAGYMNAVLELLSQTTTFDVPINYIVHATGTGGTQAGLVLGAKALNTGIQILGISVDAPHRTATIRSTVRDLILTSAQLFNFDLTLHENDVTVLDRYSNGGYGVITPEKVAAIQLLAQTEGIFLDPVYTSTAMAGLLDLIRNGRFT